MFCESINSKSTNLKVDMKFSILKQTNSVNFQPESPVHKQFIQQRILQDRTNSPISKLCISKETTKIQEFESQTNKFFLEDLDFLKTKKNKKSKKKDKAARKYLKLKKSNTFYNQGYKTIIPTKSPVVLGILLNTENSTSLPT